MAEDLHNDENKYHGIYRARVVEVDCEEDGEKNKFGGIRVYIPDIMVDSVDKDIDPKSTGVMAYPIFFSSLGGYNTEDSKKSSYYASSVCVPLVGSYVFIIFEGGNIDMPFYFGGFNGKMQPLPPSNRGVDEPHKVYTVIITGSGRSIIICDSEDQARVEITGKKRKLNDSEGPQGNSDSVYTIDDNQTSILLDERDGKEKLLIRSHKGDFINFDIQNRKLQIQIENSIDISSNDKITLSAQKGFEIVSGSGGFNLQVKNAINMVTNAAYNLFAKAQLSLKSKSIIAIDGIQTYTQTNKAQVADGTSKNNPVGDRD